MNGSNAETNIGLLIAVIGIVIALIGVQLFAMSQIIVAIDRSTDQISREIKDARDLVIWSYATGAKSTPTPMPTHTPTPIETPITPEPTQTSVTPLPTETTPGSGFESNIRDRRIFGSGISFEKDGMKQQGCLGIYSDGGEVDAMKNILPRSTY